MKGKTVKGKKNKKARRRK